jgi:nitrous oxide reductase accessory protein NosL
MGRLHQRHQSRRIRLNLQQNTFVTIGRHRHGHHQTLHVADNTNETQWLHPNDETAFEAYCEIWVIT